MLTHFHCAPTQKHAFSRRLYLFGVYRRAPYDEELRMRDVQKREKELNGGTQKFFTVHKLLLFKRIFLHIEKLCILFWLVHELFILPALKEKRVSTYLATVKGGTASSCCFVGDCWAALFTSVRMSQLRLFSFKFAVTVLSVGTKF